MYPCGNWGSREKTEAVPSPPTVVLHPYLVAQHILALLGSLGHLVVQVPQVTHLDLAGHMILLHLLCLEKYKGCAFFLHRAAFKVLHCPNTKGQSAKWTQGQGGAELLGILFTYSPCDHSSSSEAWLRIAAPDKVLHPLQRFTAEIKALPNKCYHASLMQNCHQDLYHGMSCNSS